MKDLLTIMIRDFRGMHTQMELSQKLGFTFNQVFRWETNRKIIYWEDFILLGRQCGFDLSGSLKRVFNAKKNFYTSKDIASFIAKKGDLSSVAEEFNVSRFVFSNWKSCRSKMPMTNLLEYLQNRGILLVFFDELYGYEKYPYLEIEKQRRKVFSELIGKNIRLGFVLEIIRSQDYAKLKKHKIGFVASKLGVKIAEEEFAIGKLEKLDIIRIKKGKYIYNNNIKFIRDRNSLEHITTLKAILAQSQKELEKTDRRFVIENFHLYTLTQDSIDLVKEFYDELNHKIYDLIVKDSNQPNKKYFMSTHLLSEICD